MDVVRCCYSYKAEVNATVVVCLKYDYYICANCPKAKAFTPSKRSFKVKLLALFSITYCISTNFYLSRFLSLYHS